MDNILFPEQIDYINNSMDSSNDLLAEMEEFAGIHRIPILNKSSALFLEQLVLTKKPKRFLEIGMAIGYSTIRTAKIVKDFGEIFTIEKSKDNIRIAERNIKKAGLDGKIKIYEGDAIEILENIGQTFDFIFLDADKEDYLKLFDLSLKVLEANGIILIDNLLWKGFTASKDIPDKYKKSTELIRQFNAYFLANPLLKSSILPIGDGLGLGIKTTD